VTEPYRLWYVRRDEQMQGPFPEALICRYIALGRIGERHELSLDGHYWRKLHELPELIETTRGLLYATDEVSADDVDWKMERAKAALRWLDDRKSPDPRKEEDEERRSEKNIERSGSDRRTTAESVDVHVYRENRAMFESWSRLRQAHFGWAVVFVLACALLVLVAAIFMQPVRPVKVGLQIVREANCTAPAAKEVNWSGCDKNGELLVGADLRGAALRGTRFNHARLRYADLTQANLTQAELADADLTGAKLGGAVWVDGQVCAADAVTVCKK